MIHGVGRRLGPQGVECSFHSLAGRGDCGGGGFMYFVDHQLHSPVSAFAPIHDAPDSDVDHKGYFDLRLNHPTSRVSMSFINPQLSHLVIAVDRTERLNCLLKKQGLVA